MILPRYSKRLAAKYIAVESNAGRIRKRQENHGDMWQRRHIPSPTAKVTPTPKNAI